MVLPILISVSLTPGPYFFSAAHTNETLAKTAVKAIDASQWFLMMPSLLGLTFFVGDLRRSGGQSHSCLAVMLFPLGMLVDLYRISVAIARSTLGDGHTAC